MPGNNNNNNQANNTHHHAPVLPILFVRRGPRRLFEAPTAAQLRELEVNGLFEATATPSTGSENSANPITMPAAPVSSPRNTISG